MQDPQTLTLSPRESLSRVKNGGTLIMLDFPPGSEICIDLREYYTPSPQHNQHQMNPSAPANNPSQNYHFRGFKGIPPDQIHFVHYVPFGSMKEARIGIPLLFKQAEIIILRYDSTSDLVTVIKQDVSKSDPLYTHIIYQIRNMEWDSYLAMYPVSMGQDWNHLIKYVTEQNLNYVALHSGQCYIVQNKDDTFMLENRIHGQSSASSFHNAHHDDINNKNSSSTTLLPILSHDTLQFSQIQFIRRLPGMSATEITKFNLDKSRLFTTILKDNFSDSFNLILGEIQISFLLFVLSFSFDALERWKTLVNITCNCDHLLYIHPSYFTDFLAVLYHQLRQAPLDFFSDDMSRNNFLRSAITSLNETIEDSENLDPKLLKRFKHFKRFIADRFDWIIINPNTDEGDDDEGPVIVPAAYLPSTENQAHDTPSSSSSYPEAFLQRRTLLENALNK